MTDFRPTNRQIEEVATAIAKTLGYHGTTYASHTPAEPVVLDGPPPEKLESVIAERDALRAFAQGVMESWPVCDIDGGDLQELAVQHGLLTSCIADSPCGDECLCEDFPSRCLRHTALLTGPGSSPGYPAE